MDEEMAMHGRGPGAVRLSRADVRLENLRLKKWLHMLAHWGEFTTRNFAKLKSRVRKGVPDALRRYVWPRLAGADVSKMRYVGLYDSLLTRTPRRSDLNCITVDLPRTYPTHFLFTADTDGTASYGTASPASGLPQEERMTYGQRALRDVLRAYAVYDQSVGYCQGMAFVAGLLLSYMPEEDAFFMLHALMQGKYGLAGMYSPGLPRFAEVMHVFGVLVKRHLPRLAAHLEELGIDHTMYASQWFITIFTYSFSFELVTRVWDIFLLEGWKPVFRVALAVLKTFQTELIRCDFDETMELLKTRATCPPAGPTLALALSIPLKRADIERLGSAYRVEHAAEIRAGVQAAMADAEKKERMLLELEQQSHGGATRGAGAAAVPEAPLPRYRAAAPRLSTSGSSAAMRADIAPTREPPVAGARAAPAPSASSAASRAAAIMAADQAAFLKAFPISPLDMSSRHAHAGPSDRVPVLASSANSSIPSSPLTLGLSPRTSMNADALGNDGDQQRAGSGAAAAAPGVTARRGHYRGASADTVTSAAHSLPDSMRAETASTLTLPPSYSTTVAQTLSLSSAAGPLGMSPIAPTIPDAGDGGMLLPRRNSKAGGAGGTLSMGDEDDDLAVAYNAALTALDAGGLTVSAPSQKISQVVRLPDAALRAQAEEEIQRRLAAVAAAHSRQALLSRERSRSATDAPVAIRLSPRTAPDDFYRSDSDGETRKRNRRGRHASYDSAEEAAAVFGASFSSSDDEKPSTLHDPRTVLPRNDGMHALARPGPPASATSEQRGRAASDPSSRAAAASAIAELRAERTRHARMGLSDGVASGGALSAREAARSSQLAVGGSLRRATTFTARPPPVGDRSRPPTTSASSASLIPRRADAVKSGGSAPRTSAIPTTPLSRLDAPFVSSIVQSASLSSSSSSSLAAPLDARRLPSGPVRRAPPVPGTSSLMETTAPAGYAARHQSARAGAPQARSIDIPVAGASSVPHAALSPSRIPVHASLVSIPAGSTGRRTASARAMHS